MAKLLQRDDGAERKSRGLRCESLTLVKGGGEKKDWPESRQVKDPFSLNRYKTWKLEPLPLGEGSLEQLCDLLLDSTDFATTVAQISADVTGLGYHFVPIDEERKNPRELETIKAFFDDCNPDLTFDEICNMVNMDWEALGNGYIEVTRRDNDPAEIVERLDWVPAREVRITKDSKNAVQIRSTKKAWFRWFGSDPDETTSKHPDTRRGVEVDQVVLNEMIWFKHPHPKSSVYGIPKIIPALGAIRGNQFQQDRNLSFFQNKALPEWAIEVSGDLVGTGDDEAEKELQTFRDNLKDHLTYMVKGKHYRLLYIERPPGLELKWHKLIDEVRDADYRMYRRDNRDEALRAYGMQPNRVGVIESGNIGGGTGESQIEIYKNSIVKPRQEKWERKMTSLIHLGLRIETYRMKFDEIDAIDEEREAKILAMIGQLPFLKINEGRRWISKFLKMPLEDIDEPWADYPFAIIATQLAMLNLGIGENVSTTKAILRGSVPALEILFADSQGNDEAMELYESLRKRLEDMQALTGESENAMSLYHALSNRIRSLEAGSGSKD